MSRNKIISIIPFLSGLLMWVLIEFTLLTEVVLWTAQLFLFFSIILVIWQGSNLLVESSQDIANHFHVSPFLIGLTIVAFGTSIPELVTSLVAGFGGKGDIAVANVVGSNILNISVILGGLALLTKGGLVINRQTIRLDAPVLVFGVLLILLFVGQSPVDTSFTNELKQFGILNLKLDYIDSIVLLSVFSSYLYVIISMRKKTNEPMLQSTTDVVLLNQQLPKVGIDNNINKKTLAPKVIRILAGLTLVMLGCHVLVGEVKLVDGVITGYGAVWFASVLGVPDFLIGLSIVALGTSVPEIVVSLSAIRAKAIDVGVGNLLGSAIFNVFVVLGITGLFVQPPLADSITISISVLHSLIIMGLLFLILFVFLTTNQRLSRKEGFVLLCIGLTYMIYEIIVNFS